MPEKRKTRRMDLECKLLLKRVDTLDTQTSKEVSVKITDVSKEGIGFECSEELRVGSVYECHLTLWTKETIHAVVEIIWILKKNDRFIYGGIFIGMSETDASRIRIYSDFSNMEIKY